MIHANGALLNLHSPCADEGDDEDNCEKGVKENLNRVVTGNPVTLHLTPEGMDNGLELTLNGTNGGAGLEEIRFLKPVNTGTNLVCTKGYEHINYEDNLKKKEENAAHYLSVIEISEAENKEGKLNCPVTLNECVEDLYASVLNSKGDVLNTAPELKSKPLEPQRKGAEEEKPEVIPKGIPFTEL